MKKRLIMEQKIFEWKSKQGELSKFLKNLTQDYFIENVIVTYYGMKWPVPAYFAKRVLVICSDKKEKNDEERKE